MRLGRPCTYPCLLALLLCVSTARAGVNQWTPAGPEGGMVTAVTLLPSQPGVALAAGGNSIYRTTDSGLTWAKVVTGLPGPPQFFAVDPTNSNRVLASELYGPTSTGLGSLYRSDDGGVTFSATPYPTDIQIKVLAFSADGTKLYGGSAGMGRMFVSSDQGAHWTEISNGLPGAASHEPAAISVDPTDPNTLYVTIFDHGVYRSTNGGQTWTLGGPLGPIVGALIRRIAIDPTNPSRLIAAANSGLWMSTDRGTSWTAALNAPESSYGWVGFDPSDPTKILACGGDTFCVTNTDLASGPWQFTQGFFIGWIQDASFDAGRLLVASSTGAQYSPDAGDTFFTRDHGIGTSVASQLVAAQDGVIYSGFYNGLAAVYKRDANGWNPGNIYEMFMLQGQQPGIGLVPNITSLSVAPSDSAMVYAVGYRGAMRSSDGGAHWSKAATQFDTVITTQVLADPNDPQVAYLTTLEAGLWRTANGGTSWEKRSAGLPDSMGPMAIDPSNTSVVYAAGGGTQATVYKSTDAGLHWAATGLGPQMIRSLAIDPTQPAVVYVTRVDDVFRSPDAGATWKPLNTGLGLINEILIDPEVPGVLTAIGQTLTATGLRSVDSGTTWEPLSPGPRTLPTELRHGVLDPLRPHHIFAATAMNGMLELEVAPDLRVSVESLPATLTRSTTVEITVRASNAGPLAASDVKLSISLPTWLTVPSVPLGCSVSGANLQCAVGAIRNGESFGKKIMLAVANTDETGTLAASVSGHEPDPEMSNNSLSVSVAAVPAPPAPPAPPASPPPPAAPAPPATPPAAAPASSGGGGGSFEWISLLALLLYRLRARAASSF